MYDLERDPREMRSVYADPAYAATVQPGKGERPAANAAWIEQSGDRAKLIFELAAPLDATAFVLANPDRVIVDLPQTDFALGPQTGKVAVLRRKAGLIAVTKSLAFEWGASGVARAYGARATGIAGAPRASSQSL